jgi:acetylornithine deacetylase/succinyl-diaminopimelate desuccinylase-like protein
VADDAGRAAAIAAAREHYDSGAFLALLARRVARHTESPVAASAPEMRAYLADEMTPYLDGLGFSSRIVSRGERGHFLLGSRHEGDDLPTVLIYGHGDVVPGMAGAWTANRNPWAITADGERLYGRGMADNKGQHSVNLSALACVLQARGRLGFNVRLLLEMGEELGSPGLREICRDERAALAADVLIASDGPRLSPERPTLFLGSRGAVRLRLVAHLREGAHHSGNWGGLISNAATVLTHALASLTDAHGRLTVDGLRPAALPADVRAALADVEVSGGPGAPPVEPDWGEPGLSPAERVFGWNTLEILAISSGNIRQPAAAIPGTAEAVVMLRFVVGLDWHDVEGILQRHLDANGFPMVRVTVADGGNATRTSAANPWVGRVLASIARTTGKKPALLPNFGGTLPNDVFVEELNLPTIWLPHSYPGCSQHAPDEHNLVPVLREGLDMMTGLFWDIGAGPA